MKLISPEVTLTLWIIVVVNFGIWAATVFYTAGISKAALYHPILIYQIYHFFGFVHRPFVIATEGYSPIWARTRVFPTSESLIYSDILINLALLIIIGTFAVMNRGRAVSKLRPAQLEITRPRRFAVVTMAIIVLGLYANYRGYAGAGLDSVQAFATQWDEQGGQRLVGVSGYTLALGEFIPMACIILFLIPATRRLSYLLIASYVALRLYVGAQRLSFVVVLAAVALISLVNSGRRYPKFATCLMVVIFAFVFDLVGSDRYVFRRIALGEAAPSEIVTNYFESKNKRGMSADVAEFDVSTAVFDIVPSLTGWSYGSQYLRIVIWPIPRQIWNDKPVYTSTIDLTRYGNFRNLTHTLYADAYMSFGSISMATVLFAVGAYLTWLYGRALRADSIPMLCLFWAQTVYIKTLFRDGEVTFLYFLIFSMVAAYLMIWAGGLRICSSKA